MSILTTATPVNLCEGCNTPIEWLETDVTNDAGFETWECPNCERRLVQMLLPTPLTTGVELTEA